MRRYKKILLSILALLAAFLVALAVNAGTLGSGSIGSSSVGSSESKKLLNNIGGTVTTTKPTDLILGAGDSTITTLNPWIVDSNSNLAPKVSTRGLQLGVKSSAPTAANGVIYYDSNLSKFRCYQGGAWTDCIGTSGSGVWGSITGTLTDQTDLTTYLSTNYQPIGSYLTSETDPIYTASSWYTTTNNATNWNTAYGWGNHASAGYLTTISGLNISLLTNDSGYLTSVTAHNLLSTTHGDTTAGSVTRGDIITGQGATPKWTKLAIGTSGKVLISDGTDVGWSASALGTAAYTDSTAYEVPLTFSLPLSRSVNTISCPTCALTTTTLTAGVGLSGGGDLSTNRTFTFDATELGNLVWGSGTDASVTHTYSLSGATDPVWTISNNSVDLTTGVLKYANNTVATLANKLSAFTSTTSAELAGVLSNETGADSGSPLAVFNVNPTLTGATMAGNLDFATYKAIAMACDNGATLPTSPSPVVGQWFLHTPTGRSVLMQYDGSAWQSIFALGTMTIYVDSTDGTDSQNLGTAADASAFKTIQYAFNQIPPLYSGNITININAETYTETATLQGKKPTGNYTITIQGTTADLDTGLVVAAGATQGTWVNSPYQFQYAKVARNTGTWTADQRANKWVKFTSGGASGDVRLIDTNTTTTLTLIGKLTAAPALNDTFNIQYPATAVTDLRLGFGQQNVIINDVDFQFALGTNNGGLFGSYTEVTLNRCEISYASGAGNSVWIPQSSKVTVDTVFFQDMRFFIRGGSKVLEGRSKHLGLAAGIATMIQIDEGSILGIGDGTIIDGADLASSYGVRLLGPGTVNWNGGVSSNTMPVTLRNLATAISVESGGISINETPPFVNMGDVLTLGPSEVTTSATANKLVDTSLDFSGTGLNVQVGDRVTNHNAYSTTNHIYALVTAVDSATQLSLDTDIMTSGARYTIEKVATLNTTNMITVAGGKIASYGQILTRTATAASYTMTTYDEYVGVTSTAAARTITLPKAKNAVVGKVYTIKDESGAAATNNITVSPVNSETIDGAASYVINTNYGVVRIISNGTNWFTI